MYQFGIQNGIYYIYAKYCGNMVIVSTRDFRANQGKYLDMANSGESIIVKSRDRGCFRIVPVSDDDTVYSKEKLSSMIQHYKAQIESGNSFTKGADESGEDFVNRMLCTK